MIAKEERKRNLALGIRVRTSADSDTVALMRTRLGCSCWLGWPQHATVRAQQIGRPLPLADGRPSKITAVNGLVAIPRTSVNAAKDSDSVNADLR